MEEFEKTQTLTNIRIIYGAYGTLAGEEHVGVVDDIIEPPEGGKFCRLRGCSYLWKGDPDKKIIKLIDTPKKVFTYFIYFFTHTPVGRVFAVSMLFCPKRIIKKSLLKFLFHTSHLYKGLQQNLLPPSKYCIAIREIRRGINVLLQEIKDDKIQTLFCKLRDIGSIILESDFAYKSRGQDILPEINKENLKKAPIRELWRVMKILLQREHSLNERWENWGKALILYLIFNRKLKKWIVRFLLELDFEKIKLDEADWYFCLQRIDYDFRDVPLEERAKEKKRIDKEKGHKIPRVRIRVE